MGALGTAMIYGIIGLVISVAMLARSAEPARRARRAFDFIAWVLFWPLFAPALMGPAVQAPRPLSAHGAVRPHGGPFDARLKAADEQLVAAFPAVGAGLADVLVPEVARLRSAIEALFGMSHRLMEMDALLATSEFDVGRAHAALDELASRGLGADDPRAQSIAARIRNIERLREMRSRNAEQLERALVKLEELGSQLHVLRFLNAPEPKAVELIKEIAGSVEGITEGLIAVA
jgi:hypothetical protein